MKLKILRTVNTFVQIDLSAHLKRNVKSYLISAVTNKTSTCCWNRINN